jgi:hypothetical protein
LRLHEIEENKLITQNSKKLHEELQAQHESQKRRLEEELQQQKTLLFSNLEKELSLQSQKTQVESEKLLSSFYIFASEIKQKQEILLSEISVFSNNLDSIKSKHSSAIETFKKLSEIELKESFYRISFSSEEKEELLELSKAIKILRNPQPFYKAIYEIYYKNKVSDLVNRVVGKGRVSGIYKLTHISSGKCYIGKSVDIGER